MSCYQDIYQDLPSRVHRIWQRTKAQSTNDTEDLSVTAMLMAAATGLAMPWENLKDVGSGNSDNWDAHPSFKNDNQPHYRSVLKGCNQFLAKKASDFPCLESISFRKCQKLSEICEVAEYGIKGEKIELNVCQVRCVVRVIRNALAHNNIVAFGSSDSQIDRLGFFSENRTHSGSPSSGESYSVITITKDDFQEFLNVWFQMLCPEDQGSAQQ